MKKIISLLASMAMVFSASSMVFAAIPADATAPQAEVIVEPTGVVDGELAEYSMIVNLTDLGTVTHNKISTTKYSGTKIVQFNYEMHGADLLFGDISGNLSTAGWTGSGDSSEFTGVYVSYANTTAKTAYPSAVASTTECEEAVSLIFYGVPGATVTIENAKIGYLTYNASTGSAEGKVEYLPVTFDKTSIKLGGGEEAKTMDMTASLKGKYENGYVWEATVTPGDNALTQFKAKFTDDKDNTVERSVQNVGSMDFSGTGSLTFNVGLKTARTLSGAEFTAYATAEDYKTVAAPVE